MKTKEYIRPIPALWWLRNRFLVQYMIRELTSVFVAAYAVYLLVLIHKAGQGREVFNEFVTKTASCPLCIGFQLLCFVFVVYHSITWFNLTPKALVIWRGDEKVSPVLIAGANYALWIALSLAIVILMLAIQ